METRVARERVTNARWASVVSSTSGIRNTVMSGCARSFVMWLETSRFGRIEVDENRLLRFPKGILGFPEQTQYTLIQTGPDSVFYWLQAADRPELAFVVCDPQLFVPDYQAPIKAEEAESLGLEDPTRAQVLVIVNKVDGMVTGNLQGPLVVNFVNRIGRQLVLSEKRFATRHPLMKLSERAEVMSLTA
jgi:flagellar assembly factor FliW